MITAQDINYGMDYYNNELRQVGILNDQERECITDSIMKAGLSLEQTFIDISSDLLYPSTAVLFDEDIEEGDMKGFLRKMSLIGNELAIYLNRITGHLGKLLISDPCRLQMDLSEIQVFGHIFSAKSYEVGHDFKLNPFYEMFVDWNNEIKNMFPDSMVIAKCMMMKTAPIEPTQIIVEPKSTKSPLARKLIWKGSQIDLAELFVALIEKGWIEAIDVQTIKNSFTETKTIGTILRPDKTKYDGDEYSIVKAKPFMYFDQIAENGKRDKYKHDVE